MIETKLGQDVLNELLTFLQLHYANKLLTDDEAILNAKVIINKYNEKQAIEQELKWLLARKEELKLKICKAIAEKERNKDEREQFHQYWTIQSQLEAELRIIDYRIGELEHGNDGQGKESQSTTD